MKSPAGLSVILFLLASGLASAATTPGAETASVLTQGVDPQILAVVEKLRGMTTDMQGGNLAGMFHRIAGIKTAGTFIDLTPDQAYTLLAYCLGDKDLSAAVSLGGSSNVMEVYARVVARGHPRELAAIYQIMASQVRDPGYYKSQFRQDPTVVLLPARAEALKHLGDADPHVGLWASEFLLELGYPGEHPAVAAPSDAAVEESKQAMAAQAAAFAKLAAAGEIMPMLRNCLDKKDASIIPVILRHGDDPAAPKEMQAEMKGDRFIRLARQWMGNWGLSDFDKLQAMAAKFDPQSGASSAATVVQDILREQPEDDLYGFAKVLGGTGQKDAIAPLLDVAFSTDRQRILEVCVGGIARIGGKDATGPLAMLLERDFTSLGDNPQAVSAAQKPILDALKGLAHKGLVKELGDDAEAWHDYARKDGLIRPAILSRTARGRELALKARSDSLCFQLCFNSPEGLRYVSVDTGEETRNFHGGPIGRCTPAVGAAVIECMADRGLLDEPRGQGKGDKPPCSISIRAGRTVVCEKWVNLRADLNADGRGRETLMQIQKILAADPWTDKLVTDLYEKVHLKDWPAEAKPAGEPPVTETAPAAAPAHAAVRLVTKEVSLGKAMAPIDGLYPVFSPDGRHVVYTVKKGDSRFVVRDGVVAKESAQLLRFSDDSQHLAYVAARNQRYFVVVDGVEQKDYDVIRANSLFSPDSKRVVYWAQRGNKWLVVGDGVEGKEYEGYPTQDDCGPLFSPDSKRLAYVVNRGDRVLVVTDGAEGQEYDKIGPAGLQFSPDSRHLIYVGQRDKKQRVVVDGVEGKPYDEVWNTRPITTPDSKHVAYVAVRDGKHILVVDGVEGKEGEAGTPIYSPDSKRMVYMAYRDRRRCIFTDGIEGKEYASISYQPVFSPDSKHVAYWAENTGSKFMVLDGVEGRAYAGYTVPPPVFSPDGRRMAYWARRAEERFVTVDGVESRAWDEIGEGSPFFSPDGKHAAYAAKRGRQWLMVVDGVEAALYDNIIRPCFSPDSGHLVYEARSGGKWFVVVDGAEGTAFDGFPNRSRAIFDDPRHFHVIGTRNDEFLLMEIEIAEGS